MKKRKGKKGTDFIKIDLAMPFTNRKLKMNLHKRALEIIDNNLYIKRAFMLAALEDCESPIEQIMRAALDDAIEIFDAIDGYAVHITNQEQIGAYRVDMLLRVHEESPGKNELKMTIAVECDGHEFHEKTKEQAAHDKARDRYIQAQGVLVLRFTGSEIWADATKCAKEVVKLIRTQVVGF